MQEDSDKGTYLISLDLFIKLVTSSSLSIRFVQCRVLRVWREYIPMAQEERAKELRRAELRRKVSSWLSDYQPSPQPQ